MSGFMQALPVTLAYEGGYANHPDDRGGPTMKGVTQTVYDMWRDARGLIRRSVEEIEEHELEAIYHKGYWLAGKCDALPWPASMVHFDASVNHGPMNAAKILQEAVGAQRDGIIGPRTLGAAQTLPVADLVNRLLWARLAFYERIMVRKKSQRTFCLGWLSRVNALRVQALQDLPGAS